MSKLYIKKNSFDSPEGSRPIYVLAFLADMSTKGGWAKPLSAKKCKFFVCYLLICPIRPGAQGLTEMSSKNAIFLAAPLRQWGTKYVKCSRECLPINNPDCFVVACHCLDSWY